MKQERRKLIMNRVTTAEWLLLQNELNISVLTLNFMCVRITKVKGNDSVSKVAVFFKRERFIG